MTRDKNERMTNDRARRNRRAAAIADAFNGAWFKVRSIDDARALVAEIDATAQAALAPALADRALRLRRIEHGLKTTSDKATRDALTAEFLLLTN